MNPKGWMADLLEAWRFYRRGGAEIVFYSGHPYDSQWLQSTLERCRERARVAVIIGRDQATPEHLSDPDVFVLGPRRMHLLIAAPVFVTAESGLRRHHMPRWCRARVHMPHSLVSLHMVYPGDAMDAYDVLFCAGPHHAAELRALDRVCGLSRRGVEVGYGKMDLLRAAAAAHGAAPDAAGGTAPTVLLAPSWGDENVLEGVGEELIAALLGGGYHVIVRPHLVVKERRPDLLARFRSRFAASGRFEIDLTRQGLDALLGADVMISDWSGVAYEFAFLRRRPVLFVDVPRKVKNPGYEALGIEPMEVGLRERVGVVAPMEVDAIVLGVAELLERQQHFVDAIGRAESEVLYNPDDCAGAATDALLALLEDRR